MQHAIATSINDVNRLDRRSSVMQRCDKYMKAVLNGFQLDTRHVNEEIGRLIGNAGELTVNNWRE
jgi:hypothetical protein